ncbi:MAG: UxaA family hydrolase [Anaerolineae bacterium]|nr:UxaA family hydrolase [Anaerolineae bacterium]
MDFLGYRRPNGRVGTRNYVGIIPTVGCSCDTARQIAGNVEGCVLFSHFQGCDHTPDELDVLERTLVNLGRHPNLSAVIYVSLGCEPSDVDRIAQQVAVTGKPVETLVIQKDGGTVNTVAKGTRLSRMLAAEAQRTQREPCPLSTLVFGAECGGSDTSSGLAANPAIGSAFDILISEGGTGIFSETQEFIGAEHLLAARAKDRQLGQRILDMVAACEQRFLDMGVDMRGANPAKGNIEGGLTTIEEKSLGAISKGGTTEITGVVEYGERPEGAGLFIVNGMGMDSENLTCLAAAGANVLFFSTGRGTPVGFSFVPVIKVTGNPQTFARMSDNIDVCIDLTVDGSVEKSGRRLLDEAVEVASGRGTCAELLHQGTYNGICVTGP